MDLSQKEWSEKLDASENTAIIDVRTEEEFSEGYIPKAYNVDIHKGQGFIDEIEALDKNKTYFVYCRSGARSAQACAVMNQLGFENTYNLLGGFMEWEGEKAS
jgi:rhodanese-related sulfurtransferase